MCGWGDLRRTCFKDCGPRCRWQRRCCARGLRERWSNGARVYRKQLAILCGPFRRQTVERALGVVFLVGDHPANADDEVVKPFRCRPEITDANRTLVKVRMKDRREHAALRRAPGISQGKIDLEQMIIALKNRTVRRNIQPANQI